MDGNNICGIVVTYRPDDDVLKNLAALRQQVQHVVVVDNGSTAKDLANLRNGAATLDFDLIENGDNLGIATALNIGLRCAANLGSPFVLLMDQDSTIEEGFAQAMLTAFAESAPEARLGILNPRYIDSRSGKLLAPYLGPDGNLQAATTSGSLIPFNIFQEAGYFADELFIDCVDYEYSFRIRELGYTIRSCQQAVMLHSPGTPSYHSIFGSKRFQAANYSPIRRYYQERNKIWVARRYWRRYPSFLLLQFCIGLKDLIKIVLVEDNKRKKVAYFFLGIFHGLRGKMGRLDTT